MAFDAFLKIDGIEGESQDNKHTNWMEILSFSWGVNQPAAGSRNRGARAVEMGYAQEFSVTKTLDKGSPKLILACYGGTYIKQVKLELCRATGDKQKYMEYKMSDVIISSVHPGGSAHGTETLPVEEVSFNFGKIDMAYTVTDQKTGMPLGDVKGVLDVQQVNGDV